MRTMIKPAATALAAATLLVATAPAQNGEAFRATPADSQGLVRINFGAMDQSPHLGPIMERVRANNPNFPQSFLKDDDNDELAFLAESFPGEISALELGILQLTDDEPDGYVSIYGLIDVEEMAGLLTENGFATTSTLGERDVFTQEGEEGAVMMPNDYTMLVGTSESALTRMHAAAMGDAPNARSSNAPLAAMSSAANNAHFFAAFAIDDEMRGEIQQGVQEMTQGEGAMMLMMFPGLTQFLQELTNLSAFALSFDENEAGVRFNLGLNFPSDEHAGRATTAINQTIPAASQMLMAFSQGDPEAMEMLQTFGALRFGQSGTRSFVTVPVPQTMLDAVAEMVEDMDQVEQMMRMMQQQGQMPRQGGAAW